jgi:hypothetical protein
MACGRITYRIEAHCDRPSERAAATWLQCTELMPARFFSATSACWTS